MNLETFKSILETFKERTRNPFTEDNKTPFAGAFFLSFLLYNWKIIISLLTFDSFETRLSKIKILENFFDEKPLFLRIAIPILTAFASIFLYYMFNNMSLFITTFFNSWIRPLVYLILDKRKLVTKQELENEKELLRKATESNYTIRQKFNESESKIDRLESENSRMKSEITNISFEKQKLENEKVNYENNKNELLNRINSFEIINSRYGYKDKIFDTTLRVIDLLTNNTEFSVNNITLLNIYDDPYENFNSISITYKKNGMFYNIIASQFERIKLENNEIKVYETDDSKTQKNIFNNNLKLYHYFKGQWKLEFKKGEVKGEEILSISDLGEYFTNLSYVFKLENVNVDLINYTIEFDKVRVENNLLHSKEKLKININDLNSISGTYSLGYSLKYLRSYN